MKSIIITHKTKFPLFLIPAGIAAGFLNGLLGAGAGVVLVFVYAALSKDKNDSDTVKNNFAMTVATVIPISVFSIFTYASRVGADFSGSFVFLIPGAVGGILGAFITDKINTKYLKMIFALLTVIAGINMILR